MTTTAAQAPEALNTLADAAIEILWTERCLELSQSVRQHIESTAAELKKTPSVLLSAPPPNSGEGGRP